MRVAETTSQTADQSAPTNFARFTIHIPAHDKDGKMLHHILPAVRKMLNQNKLHGRMVMRDVESDYKDDTHQTHLLVIDAINSGEVISQIKDIARAIKEMGELEGVYCTVQPLLDAFII